MVHPKTPWKSSLLSYNTGSKTSSDVGNRYGTESSGSKSATKYSTLASPSTYRPLYSSGTYRVPVKREPSVTSTFTSKFSTSKDSLDKTTPTKSTSLADKKRSEFSGTGSRLSCNLKVTEEPKRLTPIRTTSTGTSTYRGRSTEPTNTEPTKERFSSTSSAYPSYSRLYNRTSASNYGSRYGSFSALPKIGNTKISSSTASMSEDSKSDNKSNISNGKVAEVSTEDSQPTAEISDETDEEDLGTISVSVCTRATSPTPPQSSSSNNNYIRTRRLDVAKTIEKIIQRPVRRRKCVDKEMQSDRMDDPTRYTRFNNPRSPSPWNAYGDGKYKPVNYSRYSNSASSNASMSNTNSTVSKSEREKSTDTTPNSSKSDKTTNSKVSLVRTSSNSSLNKTREERSKSTSSTSSLSDNKSKAMKKATPVANRQKSLESSSNSLPPVAPKSESPVKTITTTTNTSSSSNGNVKWTVNKDFRKSVLNVGPTDRTRKQRTTSSSDQGPKNSSSSTSVCSRTERSPSVASLQSTTSSSSNQTDFPNHTKHVVITLKPPPSPPANGNITANFTFSQPEYLSKPSNVFTVNPNCVAVDESTNKNNLANTFYSNDVVTNFFKDKLLTSDGSLNATDDNESVNNLVNSFSEGLQIDTDQLSCADSSVTMPLCSEGTEPTGWWLNTDNVFSGPDSSLHVNGNKLRHIDSGELEWWLEDTADDTIAEDVTLCENDKSSDFVNSNTAEYVPYENVKYKIRHVESGEQPWWMSAGTDESSGNLETTTCMTTTADPPPKLYKIRHIESGEKAWWMNDDNNNNNYNEIKDANSSNNNITSTTNTNTTTTTSNKFTSDSNEKPWWMISENGTNSSLSQNNVSSDKSPKFKYRIRHIESGEKAWWMQETPEDDETNEDQIPDSMIPLGDRASPEGVEDPIIKSSCSAFNDESVTVANINPPANVKTTYISQYKNIDDILGTSCRPLSPIRDIFMKNESTNGFEEISPAQVRIHDNTPQFSTIHQFPIDCVDDEVTTDLNLESKEKRFFCQQWLDDAALQVYKDGDFGTYLDLESSLAEQSEEIEGLSSSRKNSLVVRTQLSVRVHSILEKLMTSEGRELRRALFSLKQTFQEDKDLVHGFVAMGGLDCLIRLGNDAEQNLQNYILRALGQVMLYVDGMNGVMQNLSTVKWLYSLIASEYRLVVKTSLKLLLVFVEYVESNCYLVVKAIHAVDSYRGTSPWSNVMSLLRNYENADTELLIYATSLINKTLSGLSDQDSFYDESDLLEQQGMEGIVQRYMSRPGTDLDLLDQLQLYEAVLRFEDGETDCINVADNSIRKVPRCRAVKGIDSNERRKSRRHSSNSTPPPVPPHPKGYVLQRSDPLDEDSSSSANSNELNDVFRDKTIRDGPGVTPGLRRRRERNERQKTFLREQQEAAAAGLKPFDLTNDVIGQESESDEKKLLLQLKRDHTVKDLTQKLNNLPMSPQEEKPPNRIGDMTGLISKAKEGLAKSKSKGELSRSPSVDQELKKTEPKKSENELHWEELVRNLSRPLKLCDLDFTDLNSIEDEKDLLSSQTLGRGIPPPPPPIGMMPLGGIPPPLSGFQNFPPPPANLMPPPLINGVSKPNGEVNNNNNAIKKMKKTVKLFWKEVREDLIPTTVDKTIWDELPKSDVDIQKLEHLFESRAKDLLTKEKQQEMNKNKEIIVLDHKRSNAINIAMTKLPPPRAIKAAILKMDVTVVTREGIDKLLNMLPTEEERGKIQEAQMLNPELPLGSAEQFLLTLSSISELAARLRLWAFKLDFDNNEKDIAEPLMDLKQGIELLKQNRTFKHILSTLLSIGIFLNGQHVKGFQIEYLAKVPEVKDTVHKHSLLHHLCHMVMESAPDTSDLYSEIGPITRASKADFSDLAQNLVNLENECKASWDRLKLIVKHDCPPQLKQKLIDFLADCAERIIILGIIHRRIINRYRKFLLWLGVPQHRVIESRPHEVCRIVSEFALEYRTTRERVQQQIEKKANHRERNKTRGKMIIDVTKFRTQEDKADAELRQLLGSANLTQDSPDSPGSTLNWRRRKVDNIRSPLYRNSPNGDDTFTDGDDEILESLVKTATKTSGPRQAPRERKRTRNADRKSLKRSRTREGFTIERCTLSPEHV